MAVAQDREEPAEVRESDVAIIGMACRFPGAGTIEEFWRNLSEGRESTTFFTDEELLAAGVAPDEIRDDRYVKAGQILPGVEMFDADLFRIPRDEAEIIDPQQRLFLECALTALEDAGHDPDREPGAIGVYAGVGMNTYGWHHLAERFRHGSTVDRYRLMLAGDKDFLATRVSYKFGLRGPGVNVNTACSTSLVAVHMACLSLLSGDCDMALAGSAHLRVPQTEGYLHQPGMIFSPDGRCRPFDAKAQGTVLGSGVGIVVLKRLTSALADGDRVQAVVRGTAVNNDGGLKAGYTAPSVDGQAAVIADAQEVADCAPESIGYVEAHGTGTALGDPIEVAALNRAFTRSGPLAAGSCALGSVKANVGHLDTAAGMAGLIKTVLMLRHRRLAPQPNFESPNPEVPFDAGPFHVGTEARDWPAGRSPRRAGVSAFGIGGTNAHVVLQEPPVLGVTPPEARPELLLLSADTASALERATTDLARHLRAHSELPLRDVALTLALGRRAYRHRRALVAADCRDAALTLALGDRDRVLDGGAVRHGRTVTFLCAGEFADGGAHALALYEELPPFRALVDACLADRGDPVALLSASDAVAAAVAEYALGRLWSAWGVQPDEVIGEGAGWRAAGCLNGDFTVDAILEPGLRPEPPRQAPAENAVPDPDHLVLRLLPSGDDRAEPGFATLLGAVGRAWVAGAPVDWSRFHAGRPVNRVALPTYSFDRRRYWIDADTPVPSKAPRTARTLAERFEGLGPAAKAELVTRYLQELIGEAIGVEELGEVLPDPGRDLFDMNADSLMLLEITAKLSDELGCEIPSSAFIDFPSIESFVANLEELMGF
ncbi:beta-ketoacyl synthase N-terminal-like domain-containing protein [Streptomyces prunicolor]|uniref:beta-ketoacyl synthase N-terminal-like domain-containing protein n=1 Tax=Streptomyces prunicolor TaxID=67348 RepID=UPI0037D1D412